MKTILFAVSSIAILTISVNSYAAKDDNDACLSAVEAIKQYDQSNYEKARTGLNCDLNARTKEYWQCVIHDLENGGNMISSLGICENQDKR